MDAKQITALAKLLKDDGDKVLSSEFSLTFSGAMLCALNDSFALITDYKSDSKLQSFQVVETNNSKSEAFRDLQLIHDFVQKTTNLVITQYPDDDYFEGSIDVSKFHCLRRLEIKKVNITQIHGLQPLRPQLQHIVCVRSINCIEDIITYCGGDNSNGFVWNELRIADFSYNTLKTVDCSLEFAQWLQNLNLSHNQLTSVDAIKWLPNLKVLDLSFNRLTQIPVFHTEATRRLQILLLSYNFVEALSGISRLDALAELDLSNNCLLDHSNLLPLSTLIALRYLNLFGNPLYCHTKHRQTTARYLHKNTASVKFILDANPLSKSEKSLTGAYQNYYSSKLLTTSLARSSGQLTPLRISAPETPTSSIGSESSSMKVGTEEKMGSNEKGQKKIKIRTVEIEDRSNLSEEGNLLKGSLKDSVLEAINDQKKDHLVMKKQIEDLREQFGAEWLQNENAHIQNFLRISPTIETIKILSDDLIIDFLKGALPVPKKVPSIHNSNENFAISNSTPTEANTSGFNYSVASPIKERIDVAPKHIDENTFSESFYESSSDVQKNAGTVYVSVNEKSEKNLSNLDELYRTSKYESDVSESEENEKTYIVHLSNENEEIFLQVSDISIKERDILTRKTKTKWSLKILESCDRVKSNTIRINFDTIKKDKKERIYTVQEGLCQELENCLRDILSKRLLSDMNQKEYICANCSIQFCTENMCKRMPQSDVICPECKCRYVIELEETTKPKCIEVLQDGASSSKVLLSTSKILQSGASNIGSAGSLNESSCSKLSNESSFDSNQSVAGSSTHDRDNDFNFNTNKKNAESDIEILSNPSQSSIEVLDSIGNQRNPSSRKTSEERRISQIPSLETIEDKSFNNKGLATFISQNSGIESELKTLTTSTIVDTVVDSKKSSTLSPANLTESSSSGSVTDSICTAYEQNDARTNILLSPKLQSHNKKDESIISSMLGGLFQSTNILMSRSQKSNEMDPSQSCDKFKYSYTDFSEVDHRLKLYLYQHLFEDQNEHFKWLVKAKIYNQITREMFEGIIVLSTTKFYLLEIFGLEQENISKWLKRYANATADRIESVKLLPFKTGLSFTVKGLDCFLLLLQDILRTDSLMLFFANNPLPMGCELHYKTPEDLLEKIYQKSNNEQLKMFSLINNFEIIEGQKQSNQLYPISGLLTTDSHLYVTNSKLSWLNNSNENLEFIKAQLMSNLIEIDRCDKNQLTINFLDETHDKYELWKCTFETEENANCCLNTIAESWEKLFGVPLINN